MLFIVTGHGWQESGVPLLYATPDHATPDHATTGHATPDHATPEYVTPVARR